MIYAGIDVAKDKHDCFIMSSEGEVLRDVFTIPNNMDGFHDLFEKITSVSEDLSKVKVGLEATGHYSYNILGFLLDKGLTTFVINPLHTNLYRKSLSLRKTKTDKVDARIIATMLASDVNLKSYTDTAYHNEELKSLTRYRFDKVKERAKLKSSIQTIMDEIASPILTIPGIGYRMGAMILSEIGDFSRFDSPDKILAYAGLSPSTYQSGQLTSTYAHMEKRGSRYLRYAIINATKYVCHWEPTFAAYLAKKRAEGKHYNVAISHAAKKLVRLIYALEKTGLSYSPAA